MTADAAYQGVPGAFSEDAARHLLGTTATLLPCPTLRDVFRALRDGQAASVVVPTMNSIYGPVPGVTALIAAAHVHVVAEHVQPIEQAIIGVPGASIEWLRRVWSHPVALGQCRRWLSGRPSIRPVQTFDTAGAARQVLLRGVRADAAIASVRAAAVYGGVVLASAIQDEADNTTRFVLLAPERGRRFT